MDRESELALVERLRGGDAEAFDAAYAAFNRRLFTFLLLWDHAGGLAAAFEPRTRGRARIRGGDAMIDPLVRLMAELPETEPRSARSERIHARCHDVLRSQMRHLLRRYITLDLWSAGLALLGGVYVTETIRETLRLYGLL